MDYTYLLKILSSELEYKEKEYLNSINFNYYTELISKIKNPSMYDRLIKYLEFKYDTSKFNEERNKYIKNLLFNQKNNSIIDLLTSINVDNFDKILLFTDEEISYLKRNKNNFKKCLEHISDRWLTDYITYYFFQDNFYNFSVNLYQLVSYQYKIKSDLIDLSHIKMYNEFNNINNLSLLDKINLFKKYYNKNINLMHLFYDDMRIVKDHAYKNMVSNSLKINKDSKIYNKELSDKCGLDVYYLNGEKFYAFVRSLRVKRDDLDDKNNDYINSNLNKLGYSFSYISDRNIGTIDYMQKNVILFYDNIDFNNIMYVYHSDMFSGILNNKGNRYISKKVNEIHTPMSLISNTKNYNEIYVKGNNIKPTSLICYDEIANDDISFAKKYNLSILLINREKYHSYEEYDDDFYDNTYIL